MQIELPDKVKDIISTLEGEGFEAYAVGGCIRDSLTGRVPLDWDITTNAKPEIVKQIFRRTVDTGIKHGTVTVLIENDAFEVTTYRIDGEYEDNRRPKEVSFTANLEEDLKRRDFTINAMAYNDKKGLVDMYGGIKDLELKLIRAVGRPEDRFDEDVLRVLRALRFSAQLGFVIEENTKNAIMAKANLLVNISAERIRTELNKLLISDNPHYMRYVYEFGITKVVLPEFDKCMQCKQNNPHHIYSVGEHTLVALQNIENNHILRWTMLLHDIMKPECKTVGEDGIDHFTGHPTVGAERAVKILRRLKFDTNTIDKVERLVKYHDYRFDITPRNVRRAINKIGSDIFMDYIKVRRADTMAQNPATRMVKLDELEQIRQHYEQTIKQKHCVEMRQLAINGKDLIQMGVPQGEKIGEILNALLKQVIDNPELNTIEQLKNIAKTMF